MCVILLEGLASQKTIGYRIAVVVVSGSGAALLAHDVQW